MSKAVKNTIGKRKLQGLDVVLFILLTTLFLMILIPFISVVAISLTSYKEYIQSGWVFWPKEITFQSYKELFKDNRVFVGYKTTLVYVSLGVPLNLLLCTTLAYALSRRGWPGRKLLLILVLITMVFHGGIVPLYLVMKQLKLTGKIWSVILAHGMNTFNMILIYNYFNSLPESIVESARLDGANEWTILARVILPLAKPILATVVLFCAVDYWNEYFMSMIFLRGNQWRALQQVLRAIVIDSDVMDSGNSLTPIEDRNYTQGIKMAALIVTMTPIICVYPFLQKHFTKGIMIGAIKA